MGLLGCLSKCMYFEWLLTAGRLQELFSERVRFSVAWGIQDSGRASQIQALEPTCDHFVLPWAHLKTNPRDIKHWNSIHAFGILFFPNVSSDWVYWVLCWVCCCRTSEAKPWDMFPSRVKYFNMSQTMPLHPCLGNPILLEICCSYCSVELHFVECLRQNLQTCIHHEFIIPRCLSQCRSVHALAVQLDWDHAGKTTKPASMTS